MTVCTDRVAAGAWIRRVAVSTCCTLVLVLGVGARAQVASQGVPASASSTVAPAMPAPGLPAPASTSAAHSVPALAVPASGSTTAGGAVPAQAVPSSASTAALPAVPAPGLPASASTAALPPDAALLENVEHRTFEYFWDTTNPDNGLTPDHWPEGDTPFSSIAATGFALTAYPIGVERGWITREQARERVLATLRFFANAPQGPQEDGDTGYHGFFYHFLGLYTGTRYARWDEISTVDTAWFMAGVLFDESYFDEDNPQEREIRKLADQLYRAVDWRWAERNPPLLSMGWTPGGKFIEENWEGYNEAMMLYILALGSPTHPLPPQAWNAWTSTYHLTWGTFHGSKPHVGFGPLFGHEWSEAWIDFRGIQDAFMRRHQMTYFENSRRAVVGQRNYAIADPQGFKGYGPDLWGLTACNGPGNLLWTPPGGTAVRVLGYAARGADVGDVLDDGTIAPTAAISAIVFAPKLVLPTLQHMYDRYGQWLYGRYGFRDAFNPSFQPVNAPVRTGVVVPGEGWFDDEYLGIDEGPILLMIENYRSGFVWQVMRRNPYIRRGLERAGFGGGWLPPFVPPKPSAPAGSRVRAGLPTPAVGAHPETLPHQEAAKPGAAGDSLTDKALALGASWLSQMDSAVRAAVNRIQRFTTQFCVYACNRPRKQQPHGSGGHSH
ncbi:MAG TPA: glucoamylase family protein [Rhodanobacteraceae bacterium]